MKKIVLMVMLLIAGLFIVPSSEAQMLQVKGSDTLINLVQKMAEVYMQKNPDKMIAVTGGGSGTGIAALINGKCDIANASRDIKSKEVAQAEERGVEPNRIVVAVDGLSIIVNPGNTVKEMTVDEIGKVFRGEVTNWKDLGGKDMPVTLYGRQSNSGTYAFMQEEVLKGDYSPRMNQMNGNAQIVEALKNDVSGIGYVGVGYIKDAAGITVVNIAKTKGGDYVSPLNAEDVKTGRYPISRPLNQYVNGEPQGDIKDFLAFELGPEGQKIVEEEGFFTLPQEYIDYNARLGL